MGSNKDRQVPVFIDTIPNLLQSSLSEERKKEAIREGFDSRLEDIIERYSSLPALMIQPGEYCWLLKEARWLYILGYFYSCVAMCGITAERILKDIFTGHLLIIKGNQAEFPNDKMGRRLEKFGARRICQFLINAEILDQSLKSDFKNLGELRNEYAHAGGKHPQKDARKAIDHLHTIVEGTVSILKDYKIQDGKLVSKRAKEE